MDTHCWRMWLSCRLDDYLDSFIHRTIFFKKELYLPCPEKRHTAMDIVRWFALKYTSGAIVSTDGPGVLCSVRRTDIGIYEKGMMGVPIVPFMCLGDFFFGGGEYYYLVLRLNTRY